MNEISIIIPTYNEEQIVATQLRKLISEIGDDNIEIILIDSGTDKTSKIASQFDVKIIKSVKGRAIQMNEGAKASSGDILYFLHLDSDVPNNFLNSIRTQVDKNHKAGCFQMTFDDTHWLMKFYSWMTRFPFSICRGGDQSLFIKKELFEELNGFDESLRVMEDIDIINRIKKRTKFYILEEKVITSSRKYKSNGKIRLQLIFGMIHLMYNLGFSQNSLIKFYNNHVIS